MGRCDAFFCWQEAGGGEGGRKGEGGRAGVSAT